MLGHCEIPSLRAMVMSLPFTPIVTMLSRLTFFVRSGLIASHESPRSRERKTRLAAVSRTPASLGDCMSGVSQWKRYDSPLVELTTLKTVGRIDFDSPVSLSRRMMLPSCDSV